jgi:integrase
VTLWRSGRKSLDPVPEDDLLRLAGDLQRAVRRRPGEGWTLVNAPGPGVMRVRLCGDVVADIAECGFCSCLRRGNVLGLQWNRIDPVVADGVLIGGELRLPGAVTKNKRPWATPLVGRLLAVFARRWQARRLDCVHVFHRAGRPVRSFTRTWKTAAAAIGRPGLLFHDLRRSGARTLLRAGVRECGDEAGGLADARDARPLQHR